MRPLHFKSRRHLLILCAFSACATLPGRARGQACCAGTGAVTPGRLALHEMARVGMQWKAGDVLGSFDADGHYTPSPSGASELDLEQDMFGAVRVLGRGQVALLVPFIQSASGRGIRWWSIRLVSMIKPGSMGRPSAQRRAAPYRAHPAGHHDALPSISRSRSEAYTKPWVARNNFELKPGWTSGK